MPSVEHQPQPSGPVDPPGRTRDALGAAVLGWLHLALALPVLVGTVWAQLTIDRILNVSCGLVLTGVGAGLLWGSRRLSRATPQPPSSP